MDTNRSKNGQRPRQKVQTKKGPVIEDYLLLPGDLLPEFGGLLPESLHPPAGRRGLRNDSESGDPTQNLRDGSRQRRREVTDDMVRSSGMVSNKDSKDISHIEHLHPNDAFMQDPSADPEMGELKACS
ncbi:hypothetical protein BHM03_00047879 [Ensete ventricosum]|nr:hypothetical protein BHM03_00047879 [Ensete ventricosum]